MVSYKLTYFNGRGRGEPARQIFAYAGVEFEDVRFPYLHDRTQFNAFKPKTPFGFLPVLEVDGKMLAQSQAISRYLGRTFGLAGANDWEAAQIDALSDGLRDITWEKLEEWYTEQDAEKKKQLLAKVGEEVYKPGFERFSKFLTENGTGYFVGSKVSWFDIEFAEIVNNFNEFLHDYVPPKLLEFSARIREHPNLKKWNEKRPKGEF